MSDESEIALRVRLQKALVKDALKEALKEWMDEKFILFGKWSLGAACTLLMVVLAYGWLQTHGWSFAGDMKVGK